MSLLGQDVALDQIYFLKLARTCTYRAVPTTYAVNAFFAFTKYDLPRLQRADTQNVPRLFLDTPDNVSQNRHQVAPVKKQLYIHESATTQLNRVKLETQRGQLRKKTHE